MTHTDLTQEQQLILTLLQVGPLQKDRVRALLAEEISWDEVLRVAGAWGVFRLFVSRLKTAEVSNLVPDDVMAKLSRMSMGGVVQNLIRMHEFLKVWRAMKDAGIRALVFKGPVLGLQAYGDPFIRSSVDIDLVVPGHHVERTIERLTELGFQSSFQFNAVARRHWARSGRDFGVHRGALKLDFHQGMIEGPGFLRLTEEEWAKLPTLEVEGEDLFVFSRELTILSLCIHGMRHTWTPLKFLVDLAHFLDRNPEGDWDYLKERAKQMGCRRMVAMGLHLAEAVCAWPMPDAAKQALPLDKKSRKIFRHYRRRAVALNPKITALILFFGIFNGFDSAWVRMRYVAYMALTPSPQDFMLINLPKSLHWFYHAIHPLRLTWRFLLNPLQRLFRRKDTQEW